MLWFSLAIWLWQPSRHACDARVCLGTSAGTSWRPGGACRVWQQAALAAMDADLARRYGPGARILFRRGPALPALQAAAAGLGAGAVYFNRRCTGRPLRVPDTTPPGGLLAVRPQSRCILARDCLKLAHKEC